MIEFPSGLASSLPHCQAARRPISVDPSRGRFWLPVDYRIPTGLPDVTTAFLRNFSRSLEKPCRRGLKA